MKLWFGIIVTVFVPVFGIMMILTIMIASLGLGLAHDALQEIMEPGIFSLVIFAVQTSPFWLVSIIILVIILYAGFTGVRFTRKTKSEINK